MLILVFLGNCSVTSDNLETFCIFNPKINEDVPNRTDITVNRFCVTDVIIVISEFCVVSIAIVGYCISDNNTTRIINTNKDNDNNIELIISVVLIKI